MIRKDVDLYKAQIFDACFIDEAQFIKNPTSLGAKAVKAVQAKHRFALTGTPIENTLSELWSIFDFVMPGFFGRYRQFEECYEKPILRDHDSVQMQKLRRKIRPFVLRRMKKEVLTELPDKIETRRMAEMGAKQRKIYESYLARIQMELAGDEENTPGGNRMQVLAALTRLRQICLSSGNVCIKLSWWKRQAGSAYGAITGYIGGWSQCDRFFTIYFNAFNYCARVETKKYSVFLFGGIDQRAGA